MDLPRVLRRFFWFKLQEIWDLIKFFPVAVGVTLLIGTPILILAFFVGVGIDRIFHTADSVGKHYIGDCMGYGLIALSLSGVLFVASTGFVGWVASNWREAKREVYAEEQNKLTKEQE